MNSLDFLAKRAIEKLSCGENAIHINKEDLHGEYICQRCIDDLCFYLQTYYGYEEPASRMELLNFLDDYPELLNDEFLMLIIAPYLLIDFRKMEGIFDDAIFD